MVSNRQACSGRLMSTIDSQRKRVGLKIVYYGPGMSGKTTNLRAIYSQTGAEKRGKLVSRRVRGQEDLYVDLLPLSLGTIEGFDATLHLCTVPGHALYNEVRRIMLKGVDGVVFVADSRGSRMAANEDSLDSLEENLGHYDVRLESLSHVLQYNKRDLPGASDLAQMRMKLNRYNVPEFTATALNSQGVVPTLKAIVDLVREDVRERL